MPGDGGTQVVPLLPPEEEEAAMDTPVIQCGSHQPLSLLARGMLHGRCCACELCRLWWARHDIRESGGQGLNLGADTVTFAPLDGFSFLSCRKWREGAQAKECMDQSTASESSSHPFKKFESAPSTTGILILGAFWNRRLYQDSLPWLTVIRSPLWEALDDFEFSLLPWSAIPHP